MDVWPKVRERPSDSTFILESHACLSPPLAFHTSDHFLQARLALGADHKKIDLQKTLKNKGRNNFFGRCAVVSPGLCFSPRF